MLSGRRGAPGVVLPPALLGAPAVFCVNIVRFETLLVTSHVLLQLLKTPAIQEWYHDAYQQQYVVYQVPLYAGIPDEVFPRHDSL